VPAAWQYNFTDDPNGEPAGWVTFAGTEVGNATVISGMLRSPQDWWYTGVRPAATNASTHIYAQGEYQYSVAQGVDFLIGDTPAISGSTMTGFRLDSSGGVWELQGGGGSQIGTVTSPAVNTPFLLEYDYDQSTGRLIVDLDGVEIYNRVQTLTPTPTYAGTLMQGNIGLRKWSSGDWPPPPTSQELPPDDRTGIPVSLLKPISTFPPYQ
jgi:hypothetical protein